MVKVIDATNMIAGRLASKVAKLALLGEKVVVVNCENAIITGDLKFLIKKFNEKFDIGTPQHGPKWPRRPDTILRRMIRGMLPKNKRGKEALKRVEVYIQIPEEYQNAEIEKFNLQKNQYETKFTTLGELSKHIGGKWI